MTVIELPRTVLDRVHGRHGALAQPGRVQPMLRRGIRRLKSHPGADLSPREAALASVPDVWSARW